MMREHAEKKPGCRGYMDWDPTEEERWGLGWVEQWVCRMCGYRKAKSRLYKEISTPKAGRKCADINKSVHVGLTQMPIGPTSMRKLLMSAHVPPPSRQQLQATSSSVCEDIKAANTLDMHARREDLKNINILRGDASNVIDIECDGAYNNKLYSGVGRTPFQPATQCNYVVVENSTNKRQVIALENINKLCSKHGMHTGSDPPCDITSSACSSTHVMETTIGNEGEWAKACLVNLKTESDLEVKHVTTDPDTKAYMAAEELYALGVSNTEPEHLLDTRHLSDNHRKFIKGNSAVLNIMPGNNKHERETTLSSFALDLSKRCQSECEALHVKLKHCGSNPTVPVHLQLLTESIIKCYHGNHSMCELHSEMCDESNSWITRSPYLPPGFKIEYRESNFNVLEKCIMYRLSEERFHMTRLNSNSQKVESVNRSLRRSVPTNVTYSRNFDGRSHSAVHSVNNGPGESMTLLMEMEGCPVPPGSRLAKALKTDQKSYTYNKNYFKTRQAKVKRLARRTKLYQLHRDHKEDVKYKKAQLLSEKYKIRRKTTKVKKAIRTEHSYAVPSSSINAAETHNVVHVAQNSGGDASSVCGHCS